MMRILLTNDDGLFAPGILAVANALKDTAEIVVVAPDSQRSAVSHSITLHKVLRLHRMSMPGMEVEAYATNGTPTDAVMLAYFAILNEEAPDMVISGINKGPNMGEDVTYSGTVAAAMEGALIGIPSLSVSLGRYTSERFEQAAKFIAELVTQHRGLIPEPPRFININYPDLEPGKVKGIRFTKLGTRRYRDVVQEKLDPRGIRYYWIAGEKIFADNDEGTDINAVMNGYVSISPLTMDLTDYDVLAEMKERYSAIEIR